MFTFCIMKSTVEKNSFKLLEVAFFHSSIAIILMGKRELVALLNLSSFVMLSGTSSRCHGVVWLFLAVPWGCLRFVIVVFPDHAHYF